MKTLNKFILEKLKISNKQSKLDAQTFFDALFNYCKSNNVDKITALDVYTDFNDIPEIIVEPHGTRKRINFGLLPTGKTEIDCIEVWIYPEDEPEELLTNRKALEPSFNFLKEVILGTKVINDIYNYVEQ
jgi:hypothetical protein